MAHILILDDEPDACNLVKRIAEGMNHTTAAFTDEQQAIDHGKSTRVDLAILDLKLKKMSGVDVLEKLREANPSVRALILTGYPTMESYRKAFELGVADYLTKPVDVDVLEEKITEATEDLITGNHSDGPESE